ncbi:hypothetical protein L596_007439 [Steinernema carpocapsae]|uniref:Uncharacterized protein n=2 Tax=Steinernema carpocapsae TaxID=34508 RepID=A0A4U5P9Y6_STECR|nr:hypothetical protein L596_007439 [Steinernema carpocapsae]
MYSYRSRSGSVGPSGGSSSATSYRSVGVSSSDRSKDHDVLLRLPNAGGQTKSALSYRYTTSTPSASSSFRASSVDPYRSSAGGGLVRYPSASNMYKPTGSNYGMSSSYHSDYSGRSNNFSSANRFGSTDRLSSYRPSTMSVSLTTSVPSTSSRSTGSSSYLPRRTTSYGSGLPYSSPYERSSGYSSASRSSYTPSSSTSSYPRVRFEYRSKTPTAATTSDYSKLGRYDRDYKSMSRFDRESSKGSPEEDVETTFQKLYNRYVKDADSPESDNSEANIPEIRKFVSHSEAEYSCEDEESEEDESEDEFGKLRAKINLQELTPRASTEKDSTPAAVEFIPGEKREAENGPQTEVAADKSEPEKIDDKREEEMKKEEEKTKKEKKTAASDFAEKFKDLKLSPVKIEPRKLKSPVSALEKAMKLDRILNPEPKKVSPVTNGADKSTLAAKNTSPVSSKTSALRAGSKSPSPAPRITVSAPQKAPSKSRSVSRDSTNTVITAPAKAEVDEKKTSKRASRRDRTLEQLCAKLEPILKAQKEAEASSEASTEESPEVGGLMCLEVILHLVAL